MRFLTEMYRKTDGLKVQPVSVGVLEPNLTPAQTLQHKQARRNFFKSMDADNQRLGVRHVIGWEIKGAGGGMQLKSQASNIKPALEMKKTSNPGPVVDREAIMRKGLLLHKRKLLQVMLGPLTFQKLFSQNVHSKCYTYRRTSIVSCPKNSAECPVDDKLCAICSPIVSGCQFHFDHRRFEGAICMHFIYLFYLCRRAQRVLYRSSL
jgi:hypothetical protein